MKQPLISIIIPVFNGEKYLRTCLDSIINQSFRNWELILINDGSTDTSRAICDEYAVDPRVFVIHQKNRGQAISRNNGIKMAKGDFISFVDCDDWISHNMYESMLNSANKEKADVVICGYIEEYVNRKKVINDDGNLIVYNGDEALKMILQGKIGSYFWSMLYRREILIEEIPTLRLFEDHATIFKWISHADKVISLNQPLYHYRQQKRSSIHSEKWTENYYFIAIKERYYFILNHNLLPGWQRENRKIYLRECIKLTKDIARVTYFNKQMQKFIEEIKDELLRFQPIRLNEVGLKSYIRMTLLLANTDVFIFIMRFTSYFSLKRRKEKKNLFE